jgi:hypothetical protein
MESASSGAYVPVLEGHRISLAKGFYADEGTQRWLGDTAEIIISPAANPSLLRFQLTCASAQHYDRFPFNTIIYQNEIPAVALHFSESWQTQQVQIHMKSDDADIVVRIEGGGSFIPAEVMTSSDNRRLSLAFSDLVLDDLDHSSEEPASAVKCEITPEVEIENLRHQNARLREKLNKYLTWVPPGHFYSPIPDSREIRSRQEEIFDRPKFIPAINLNDAGQLRTLDSFRRLYSDQPFSDDKTEGLRYYFKNPNYAYLDALALHCMLRRTKPARVIEIGSGFSSCVTLDTNELFFNNSIDLTFIEPYPDLLLSLIKESDRKQIGLIPKKLQEVDPQKFSSLAAGDVLFIDSTHISRTGSDVNYIIFKILPMLRKGVLIHFHDIFYPFEYPREWVFEGRAWNESYLLHAFLQYNNTFKIQFFNSYLGYRYRDQLQSAMPLATKNIGGSIWIKKIG